MQDNRRPRPDPTQLPWWQRLENTKLTPLVALAFFCALAAMSGGAALVGYWVHSLKHPSIQRDAR